jgi:hypothetical protein
MQIDRTVSYQKCHSRIMHCYILSSHNSLFDFSRTVSGTWYLAYCYHHSNHSLGNVGVYLYLYFTFILQIQYIYICRPCIYYLYIYLTFTCKLLILWLCNMCIEKYFEVSYVIALKFPCTRFGYGRHDSMCVLYRNNTIPSHLIWRMLGIVIHRYGYTISLARRMIRGQVVQFVRNSMLKY